MVQAKNRKTGPSVWNDSSFAKVIFGYAVFPKPSQSHNDQLVYPFLVLIKHRDVRGNKMS